MLFHSSGTKKYWTWIVNDNSDVESAALSEKEDISNILTTSTDPEAILNAAKKEAEIVHGQPKVESDAKGLSTFERLKQKMAPITDWIKKIELN